MDVAPDLDVITQNFGCTVFPEYVVPWCAAYMHYGIDLASGNASWKPQHATRDGTVYVAGPAVVPGQPGLGTAVVISCDEGVDMLYGHLWDVNVAPGQRVRPGDVIGWTGSTGYSTGPHAHVEVRQQGNLNASPNGVLDPWPYLTFAAAPAEPEIDEEEGVTVEAVRPDGTRDFFTVLPRGVLFHTNKNPDGAWGGGPLPGEWGTVLEAVWVDWHLWVVGLGRGGGVFNMQFTWEGGWSGPHQMA